MELLRIFKIGHRYWFICQGTSTKRQRTWAKGPFRFSSQTATCYYHSNHSKVEAILLSALPKGTTSELAGLPLHYLFFYAERQARKLWIPTLKVFWSDSTRESNPGLPTLNTKITKFYCLKGIKRTFQLKTQIIDWLKKYGSN